MNRSGFRLWVGVAVFTLVMFLLSGYLWGWTSQWGDSPLFRSWPVTDSYSTLCGTLCWATAGVGMAAAARRWCAGWRYALAWLPLVVVTQLALFLGFCSAQSLQTGDGLLHQPEVPFWMTLWSLVIPVGWPLWWATAAYAFWVLPRRPAAAQELLDDDVDAAAPAAQP